MSSSSAISRRSCCPCLFTRLLELFLERIAVHAVVVAVELVDELVDRMHGFTRHEPEGLRLAATSVEIGRIDLRERQVRGLDGARVLKRLALPLLAKDLVDHLRSFRDDDLAYPRRVLAGSPSQVQAVLRPRTVSGDDALELVPIGFGVLPYAVVRLAQLRVGNGETELPDLRHIAVEELLARFLVVLRLDPPDVHRILVARDRVPVE